MLKIHAKNHTPTPNGRHTVPLSQVSEITFVYSSDHHVGVSLADNDGQIVPMGTLPPASFISHRIELNGYVGLLFEERIPSKGKSTLNLHLDVRHKVGEPLDPTPMTSAVSDPPKLSERERTRRIVMATLTTTNTMPTEAELLALEGELGFDFEEDFGEFLEDDAFDEPPITDPDPDPEPTPADADNPPADPGSDTVQ